MRCGIYTLNITFNLKFDLDYSLVHKKLFKQIAGEAERYVFNSVYFIFAFTIADFQLLFIA